ncbi:MAG TPA: NYN domain-containing protein [bacterium]|nr:NYN domain-containing protein [bacterium]
MNLVELKAEHYLFKKVDFGRVYVFVDFGNVRPWAKELWPEENKFRISQEIDIVKLAEIINWIFPIKKLFYYGRYLENTNFPKEHDNNKKHRASMFRLDKARKNGFEVKTKDIKMIPHYDESGIFLNKVPKCNFDVEITMDMITKSEKYDTVMLFSGDSDFGGLLSYLKSKGKKVVVVCTRNRMSKELQSVANVFVPAETLSGFLKLENSVIKKHSACAEV